MQNEMYLYGSETPLAQADNVLNGKKWAACGDSVTSGEKANEQDEYGRNKTYAWYVATRNNMEYLNCGISGSTMTNKQGAQNPFSVQRYLDIPKDCDYITLWFGINDGSDVPMGNIDDNTNTTWYGAWNVVLSYFIENMKPTTKIGIVISHGMIGDLRTSLLAIAERYGIKVFDIPGDPNIPYWDGYRTNGIERPIESVRTKRKEQWFTDNTHPNARGYEVLSTAFEAWLRTL